MRVCSAAGIGISILVLIGNAVCEDLAVRVSVSPAVCPVRCVTRSIFGVEQKWCDLNGSEFEDVGVIEPSFSILSALYPTIPHFAIEESSIRPIILSKYGVDGFPTLFNINSTMSARYRGSRTLESLLAFYSDVTGMKPVTLNITSGLASGSHSNLKSEGINEPENCPFSKARSPVNLLQQETYLALAITFLIMRIAYLAFPSVNTYAQYLWAKHARSIRLTSLWEHPQTCTNINSLKYPFKKRNLQALNAKAWASKSLASVSIGDTSNSHITSSGDR